jgi:putative ABC transport system permease protein
MESLQDEHRRRAASVALAMTSQIAAVWATVRLAARNVTRQRMRTTMTLAAIVFGVVGIVLSGGFVHDMIHQLGEALIHSQSGHLQAARMGFFSFGSRKPDEYLIAGSEELRARAAELPEVADVMARLSFSGLLTNGRSDLAILGEGLEPDREARLGSSLELSAGRQLRDKDRHGMLIGHGVARALRLAPGDQASLVVNAAGGAMNTLDFEIVGVFRTLSKDYDARAVKIPLAAAQELLDNPGVNALVVSLKRTSDSKRVAEALSSVFAGRQIEVKRWDELNDFYAKTVELYDRQFGVLQLIILAMVLLSVSNTVNMTVFERVGEFGTMRALGNRSRAVFVLILIESSVLGLAGASAGVAIAMLLAWGISAIGIPMPPPPNADIGYTAQIQLVPQVIAGAFAVGVLATILAAIPPALRVARTEVVEALRQNV